MFGYSIFSIEAILFYKEESIGALLNFTPPSTIPHYALLTIHFFRESELMTYSQ